ncbi:zinc ribbon domain-containing protein [Candidatus Woesearchaeota archaeon]|nr:zinc ribbon domain-containing protein [Candidatus Woesearchaeota archaeon]
MASINGWVFVVVGTVIAGMVYFFIPDMLLFEYIGIGFIAYGAIKLVLKRIKGKTQKKDLVQNNRQMHNYNMHDHHNSEQKNSQANRYDHNQPHHTKKYAQDTHENNYSHNSIRAGMQQSLSHGNATNNQNYQHVIYCRRCGNRLRLHDNFCSHCGTRQR